MSTAFEVRCVARQSEKQIRQLQEMYRRKFLRPMVEEMGKQVFGPLFKPHNKSTKKLARLKHSITRRQYLPILT